MSTITLVQYNSLPFSFNLCGAIGTFEGSNSCVQYMVSTTVHLQYGMLKLRFTMAYLSPILIRRLLHFCTKSANVWRMPEKIALYNKRFLSSAKPLRGGVKVGGQCISESYRYAYSNR